MVYVEMTLKWNNISDMHTLSTPGQFMSSFIALVQFVTTIYRVGRKSGLIRSIKEVDGAPERELALSTRDKSTANYMQAILMNVSIKRGIMGMRLF